MFVRGPVKEPWLLLLFYIYIYKYIVIDRLTSRVSENVEAVGYIQKT